MGVRELLRGMPLLQERLTYHKANYHYRETAEALYEEHLEEMKVYGIKTDEWETWLNNYRGKK